MKSLRYLPLLSAALLSLAASPVGAESPWSGSIHTGLVFSGAGGGPGGTTTGVWADGFHSIAPNWALGVEGGYVNLPRAELPVIGFPLAGSGYSWFGGDDRSSRLLSVSGAVRGRSAGPVRVHMLTTFGYYELATPNFFTGREYEKLPGFSVALGFSGSAVVSPLFQLRWHEVIRPHNDYMDIVSFEAGLRFN